MDQVSASTVADLPASPRRRRGVGPQLIVTGHFVRTGRVGGAEPMLYNLLDGLDAAGAETTLLCGSLANLSPAFRADHAGGSVSIVERGGAGSRFVAEQRACLDRGLRADAILFPNYYVPPAVSRRFGAVGVVMHDFQYRHFPQYFSLKKRAWLHASQSFAMRRADRVIAISEFVREDAVRLFGGRFASKLTVVPNAMSWDRFAAGIDRPRPCLRPYILSVAAQYPHKNLETLIKAFAIVADGDKDIQLVLCGQRYDGLHGVAAGRSGIGPLIEALGLAGRVQLTGYVDDAALAQWYRHAALFAFPSLFEGFGMPPVEALGFGLPTLTTARAALPEVTRGLAHTLQDPLHAGEWASAITAILRNPDQYRPSRPEIAALKAFYQPARIAKAYLTALGC